MTDLDGALRALPVRDLLARSERAGAMEVRAVLRKRHRDLRDLAVLLSDAADERLEEIARASAELTARRFGRTILLYTPLYLSNECVNGCIYCGFRSDLQVKRSTLSPEEIDRESQRKTAEELAEKIDRFLFDRLISHGARVLIQGHDVETLGENLALDKQGAALDKCFM